MLAPWLNYECSKGYLDAGKKAIENKGYRENKCFQRETNRRKHWGWQHWRLIIWWGVLCCINKTPILANNGLVMELINGKTESSDSFEND